MQTDVELRHYGKRIPYFAFFVEHFSKVNEMHLGHEKRLIWTDGRMKRLYRVMLKIERNWDELQSLGRQIEMQHGYDTEVAMYFDQIHDIMQGLVNLINGFDDVAKAIFEKQMVTVH